MVDHPATPPTGGLTVERLEKAKTQHSYDWDRTPHCSICLALDAAEAYLRLRGELGEMLRTHPHRSYDEFRMALQRLLYTTVATPTKEQNNG